MTLKILVENLLQSHPAFREKKNKDSVLVDILIGRHFKLAEVVRTGLMSKGQLLTVVKEYATMDRAWNEAIL